MTYSARDYARALRDVADDSMAFERIIASLDEAAAELNVDDTVRSFFEDTRCAITKQEKVLHDAFAARVDPIAYQTLHALVLNRQVRLLAQVVASGKELMASRSGTSLVTVVSATVLSDAQRNRLAEVIEKRCARPVAISYRHDQAIIGGLQIIFDGARRWDGSVAGRLARLRQHIMVATA